jgi:hypothetical protein
VERRTASPSTKRHDQEVNIKIKKNGEMYSFPGLSRDFDINEILADPDTRQNYFSDMECQSAKKNGAG